uniref:hypothetical protein n=1 Tax=Streptomyces cinerochromogenes TaxID=66422 RepID=UPI001E33F6AA|nr:hypothetical protein [Streptomyces cinerochromogenes]
MARSKQNQTMSTTCMTPEGGRTNANVNFQLMLVAKATTGIPKARSRSPVRMSST